ncbi:transposase [Amycolatopsis sp. PS_44_ISF1]|nr:transposase [Amycolatopsis sp. PS_44_ISF1]
MLPGVSRFRLLSHAQWVLIEDLLPARAGKRGRPFSPARAMVEGIIYRYRCGLTWQDVPAVFVPWQTIWTWHRRMAGDGTWDTVLQRLLAEADAAGLVDRAGASARHHHHPPHRGLGRTTRIYAPSRLTTRSAAPAAAGAPQCTTSSTGTPGRW